MTTTETTETTTGTTEPSHPAAPFNGISVRTRITGAVSLLVALALAGTGLTAYVVERERIESTVVTSVDQELGEFEILESRGIDPGTSDRFTDAPTLIRTFLQRNVPDPDELLVGWWDGQPRVRQPSDDLTADETFRRTVADLLATGAGSTRYVSPTDGELLVVVQQVTTADAGPGDQPAALVVVRYLDRSRAELGDTMRTYSLAALLSWLAITFFAAWLSGRLLRPLRTLRETTSDITTHDLSRRIPEQGNDDVTALTRTINRMLDRLQAGFAEQRRFLDDAGHELKTPLTVMSGHLELLDPDDPADVETTRRLLAEEVDRMGRLVGDLSMLAKARRPDFITPARTDVADLTRQALTKASALGHRDWRLDGAAEVCAVLDGQRLTQALLQLCDNAVKHTDTGQAVAVGSSYDGGVLRFWVRDDGRGVPAEDHDRVFQRFGRSHVPPGDEGYGLGLSIVRAIAEAHGGTAEVTNAEAGSDLSGAVFTITLPIPEDESWPAS